MSRIFCSYYSIQTHYFAACRLAWRHTKYVRNMQTWHIRSYGVIYQQMSERKLSDIYQNKQRSTRARQSGHNWSLFLCKITQLRLPYLKKNIRQHGLQLKLTTYYTLRFFLFGLKTVRRSLLLRNTHRDKMWRAFKCRNIRPFQLGCGISMNTTWYQQNGARPHTGKVFGLLRLHGA